MNSTRIGLLTIGQSPREDITSEIKPLFLPSIEIMEAGLLDNLRITKIEQLRPEKEETPLVSRLRNGSQVLLSERKICTLLPEVIDAMKNEMKVDVVGMLCTHDFPKIEFSSSVIFPFSYMIFLITEVLHIQSLGVVVPLENQMEMVIKKWKKEKIIVKAKSPYAEGNSWAEIAQEFIRENVDAVILDCIGYKIQDKRELQNLISIPILLPRIILTYAINQLF